MKTKSIYTRLFQEGENLERFILECIPKLKDGNILVVTSKIVALAERRTANPQEKEKIILKESAWTMPTKYVWLTIKDGMFMAAAGIDESNAKGKIILLPKDSFKAAARLRRVLLKRYKIKKLGVLITDSRVLPLRAGVVGVALGYAGFAGIKDYRGSADLFGRTLKMTRVDIADSLATAAVLLMGEGNERKPLAVIEDAPVEFREHVNRQELVIPVADDLYVPLFGKLSLKKPKRKRRD
ncbi:MAG TPA: coenzyme F420-0:L-glutamate ligase [Candidatus Paceibacterota bacterium]|jgi:coenzyme F420-0:L-glutamate ligase